MSRGRANHSVAGVVWRGMLSVPDSDSWPSLPCHCQGRPRVQARVPEWQENSGHGDVFCWGLVRALALQRDNSSGLYPSVRESLMEESA